jgi:hypothetical protein
MTVDCRYANSQVQPLAGFVPILEEAFQRLRKINVKLNPQKTDLCSKEMTWCGRKISVEGIMFDSEMIERLLNLPEPENEANLQKFL